MSSANACEGFNVIIMRVAQLSLSHSIHFGILFRTVSSQNCPVEGSIVKLMRGDHGPVDMTSTLKKVWTRTCEAEAANVIRCVSVWTGASVCVLHFSECMDVLQFISKMRIILWRVCIRHMNDCVGCRGEGVCVVSPVQFVGQVSHCILISGKQLVCCCC